MRILTVCTGNVARSAMLGFMFTTLAEGDGLDWSVRSAGTHVIEGSTMSSRTRDALVSIDELGEHRYSAHRSHQVSESDLHWADVVVTAEADHVRFVRALAPRDASRVVQLRQFVESAPEGVDLADQLAAVSRLAEDPSLDVPDPAGGDQDTYDTIARTLWRLAQDFVVRVGS